MRSVAFLLLLTSLLVISGCGSEINKTMQSWVGHHSSEVIAAWGPPSRVLDDGSGGKLLIWEYGRSYTTPGYATTQPYGVMSHPYYQTTYQPPQTSGYTASRTFWVNAEGVIYNWAWKGY